VSKDGIGIAQGAWLQGADIMTAFRRFVIAGVPAAMALAHLMAQGPPDASAILAATREALGGEQRLSAVRSFVASGRTRQVRGDNLVPIEFEISCELPDKYIRRDEIPAQESGPTTIGFNGAALIQLPAPQLPVMPARAGGPPGPNPVQLEAARTARVTVAKQDFARLALGMFASSFSSYPLAFTYVGEAEAPQGRADVVEFLAAGGARGSGPALPAVAPARADAPAPELSRGVGPAPQAPGLARGRGGPGPANFTVRLFVYRDTHLPIMLSWQAMLQGKPVEQRLYYADYREVDGVRWPFRLRRSTGSDTTEETVFDRYRINPKIDPRKFEVK
jgi:hypothetical protein